MIISLIGSRRFDEWFYIWKECLQLAGHTLVDNIINCEATFLLNKFAYIGEQTLSELNLALNLNKQIIALESWGKGNGINHLHFTEVQNSTKRYGIKNAISPIDTFQFMSPWDIEIMGNAGSLRNKINNFIKLKEFDILGHNDDTLKHSWET